MTRFLSIILNPTSGARTSATFLEETLLPLLHAYNASIEVDAVAERVEWEILTSLKENDGVRLGALLRARWDGKEAVRVVVLGGDGTSHELIEGFFPPSTLSLTTSTTSPTLELIPLPLGTANALYNTLHPPSTLLSSPASPPPSFASTLNLTNAQTWSLRSILSYLTSPSNSSATSNLLPLPLTLTTLLPPPTSTSSQPPVKLLTHIVLSTAMHASLLERSEAFRAEYPGVERFKLAAEQVLSLPFPGRLTLLAPTNTSSSSPQPQRVLRYSPSSQTFQPLASTSSVLEGPFAYVLSSTVVSRLEASFVIQPLLERFPPGGGEGTMDLVVLRPERSRKVKEGGEAGGWEGVVRGVMGGAYHDGKHVEELLSDPVEGAVEDGGEGVTEVYRVRGWEWEPFSPDASQSTSPSHVICADGAIHRIPVGGKAVVEVLGGGGGRGVRVWR